MTNVAPGCAPPRTSKNLSTDALIAVAAALVLMLAAGPVQMNEMNLGCLTADSTAYTRNAPNWICSRVSGLGLHEGGGAVQRGHSPHAPTRCDAPPRHPPTHPLADTHGPGRAGAAPSSSRGRCGPMRRRRCASCSPDRCSGRPTCRYEAAAGVMRVQPRGHRASGMAPKCTPLQRDVRWDAAARCDCRRCAATVHARLGGRLILDRLPDVGLAHLQEHAGEWTRGRARSGRWR